ncbi:MAG: ParB/RepB/Spo0J family partition protein [Planctomycetota bacterium]|nr:MAG: ParB/RepB/Spo0J family partition protein [Planctomycetota bacterium]REK28023.1 MAG: ParB/RepB/Spo0J family partition protein [Planctomycetota bacterium]REK37550.1 MAG: ParB/RepB/Spo0J family partition protein [Planctomycetota bacterium]
MATTRRTLEQLGSNLDESMGARRDRRRSQLSPVAAPKDIGRKPAGGFGKIAINRLLPDPHQPRKEVSDESIARLARSLHSKGQLFPIRVRWDEQQQAWIIISGERRWRAAQAAGLESIDCYFHEGPLSESELLEQQVVENLLREDLKPIEEARAFASLMELNGWNGKQLAAALHIDPSKVSRALALLNLPEDVQQQVDSGQLAARSAYEISKLPGDEARRRLAQSAASGRMTHKQAANAVRQRRGKPKETRQRTTLTFPAENGWYVVIRGKKDGTYHDVQEALEQALEDVRARIKSNIKLHF